jgi:hypothetical protein
MERLKGHGFVTFNRYQNRRNMRKYWIIHFWYVWTCFKCVLFLRFAFEFTRIGRFDDISSWICVFGDHQK